MANSPHNHIQVPVGTIPKVLPHAIELRHRLHAIPELFYQEVKTSALIRSELQRLGIPFTAGVPGADTATIALIGDPSKPCVAFRADMDALPNLQQCVSRELNPVEPGLVTVGSVQAGTAVNIIPDRARIIGTARSLSPATRTMLRNSIQRRCAGVAAAQGCQLEFEWTDGYPPVVNNAPMAAYTADVARQVLGTDRFMPLVHPSMGGEDFAYYLEKVPGAFFLLGVCPPGQESYHPLHSNRYDFPDGAMEFGIRMFCGLAVSFSSLTSVVDHHG